MVTVVSSAATGVREGGQSFGGSKLVETLVVGIINVGDKIQDAMSQHGIPINDVIKRAQEYGVAGDKSFAAAEATKITAVTVGSAKTQSTGQSIS